MNINFTPISFQKKIPYAKCKVLDKATNEYVGATFYEYDCKNKSDYYEVRNLGGKWAFRLETANAMETKYRKSQKGEIDPRSFYCLETDKNEIIGLCYAEDFGPELAIQYMSKNLNSNYKYIGKNMLVMMSKIAFIADKYKLIIKNALDSAWDFYEKGCGFRPVGDFCSDLEMKQDEMIGFVFQNQNRVEI